MVRSSRWFNLPGFLLVIGIIAVWELLTLTNLLDFDYLPAPHEVAASLVMLFADGELTVALLHTIGVVLQAWIIAVVLGILFGILLGKLTSMQWLFGSTVDVLRSLPIAALVPVVMLVLGLTRDAEVFVAAFGAVWPMVVNVAGSVQHVHPRLRDVATTFGLSPVAALRKITLPALLPAVLVGARLAMALSLVLVVVAEMIGNPTGLGYGLVKWQFALRPEAMWAYLIVIGVLGFCLNWVLVSASALVTGNGKERQ